MPNNQTTHKDDHKGTDTKGFNPVQENKTDAQKKAEDAKKEDGDKSEAEAKKNAADRAQAVGTFAPNPDADNGPGHSKAITREDEERACLYAVKHLGYSKGEGNSFTRNGAFSDRATLAADVIGTYGRDAIENALREDHDQ